MLALSHPPSTKEVSQASVLRDRVQTETGSSQESLENSQPTQVHGTSGLCQRGLKAGGCL